MFKSCKFGFTKFCYIMRKRHIVKIDLTSLYKNYNITIMIKFCIHRLHSKTKLLRVQIMKF